MALNIKSRTLRAEIDLKNQDGQILPGMYAFARVIIERKGKWTLPVSALMHLGDRTILSVGEKQFCWLYKDGRARQIEVETGVLGDVDAKTGIQLIEVINWRYTASAADEEEPWTPIDGSEQLILGDLSTLADGMPVKIAPADPEASDEMRAPGRRPAAAKSGPKIVQ